MKRVLIVLGLVLISSFLTNGRAQEEGFPVQPYVGARIGFPFVLNVQFGLDFGAFGVRGAVGYLPVGDGIYHIMLDGLLRIPIDANGSNAYLGVGLGLTRLGEVAFLGGSATPSFAARAVLGIEFRFDPQLGFLLEITPLWLTFADRVQLAFFPMTAFYFGLNYHLQ